MLTRPKLLAALRPSGSSGAVGHQAHQARSTVSSPERLRWRSEKTK